MKNKEFDFSDKIRELDLKIMNDEISLLVFLNLRNELDRKFIKKLKNTIIAEEKVANKYDNDISQAVRVILNGFKIQIDKLAGKELCL